MLVLVTEVEVQDDVLFCATVRKSIEISNLPYQGRFLKEEIIESWDQLFYCLSNIFFMCFAFTPGNFGHLLKTFKFPLRTIQKLDTVF